MRICTRKVERFWWWVEWPSKTLKMLPNVRNRKLSDALWSVIGTVSRSPGKVWQFSRAYHLHPHNTTRWSSARSEILDKISWANLYSRALPPTDPSGRGNQAHLSWLRVDNHLEQKKVISHSSSLDLSLLAGSCRSRSPSAATLRAAWREALSSLRCFFNFLLSLALVLTPHWFDCCFFVAGIREIEKNDGFHSASVNLHRISNRKLGGEYTHNFASFSYTSLCCVINAQILNCARTAVKGVIF